MATSKLMLEEIKRKLPIEDLIRKVGGADLHGDGTTLTGWHKAHESTSKNSLHVDTHKGVYHCFGCGQGGDIFTWLGHIRFNGSYTDHDAAMFSEVLTEAAELAGVDLPTIDKKALAERRSIEGIFSAAADFYHAALPIDQRAWLHSRYGLTDETIDALKLGFAPVGKTALFAHLHNKLGIIVDDLLKTGLFIRHDSGIQDHFQGRLIFPYWSGGRVVYFIGRETDLSPQWEKERGGMKYKKLLVHNEKHPYVSEQVRNNYFYGEDVARGADTLFVTEGVTDCIIANQYGFPCISPVTVRFRKADWPTLLELTQSAKTLYIANDNEANDVGGQGALATAELLWKNGKMARLVTLPRPEGIDKVDLNDFLREQGPDAFRKVLTSAKTLLDLEIDKALATKTDEDRIVAQKAVIALLAHIKDKYTLEHWKKKLPKTLDMAAKAFSDMLRDAQSQVAQEADDDDDFPVLSEVIEKRLTEEGYTFRMNELADTIEVNGQIIGKGIAAEIRTRMRDLGFKKVEQVEDVYTTIAYHNRYHPVKQYLESLTWDGENHIRKLSQYIRDDHEPIIYPHHPNSPAQIFEVFFGRWLIGSIAKVYEGGKVKAQNPVLVLDGSQNLGKSSFARWIGSPLPNLMIEGPIRPDDKEHQRYLSSMWIWEVAEMGATTRKADREALKDFITKHEVTFRVPYEPHPVTKPALASFIGTINNENGFLTDPTGNRRFLTVRLKYIDWAYLNVVDIHQIWAQSFALYKRGESWLLNPTEIAARDGRNAEYMVEDPYEGWILKHYEIDLNQPGWQVTSNDIALRLQNAGMRGETKTIQMGISATLKRLGLRQNSNARPRAWMGIQEK